MMLCVYILVPSSFRFFSSSWYLLVFLSRSAPPEHSESAGSASTGRSTLRECALERRESERECE